MLPSDDCNECTPAYLKRRFDPLPHSSKVISYFPFVLTFLIVATIVSQKVLPLIATHTGQNKQEYGMLRMSRTSFGLPKWSRIWSVRITARRVAAVACAITIALSAVLVELILCEVSDTIDRTARGSALRITLVSLLGLIIVLVPALEIFSMVNARFKGRDLVKAGLTATVLLAWLASFWYLPNVSLLPDIARGGRMAADGTTGMFLQGCLKRIGIIGIALMAALAGFAAVSSIWQTLGVKKRTVRETDIARKETGLVSVHGMLESKQSRLRALEQRMSQLSPSTQQGFLARVAGSIKGDTDTTEKKALELEIAGLETMASSLETSLASLRSTFDTQQRATTALGKMTNAAGIAFAIYCLYRMATISFSTARRYLQSDQTISSSDPISNLLALLTTHYDATLDQQAWSRQISFAMSGVILLLSFSAVLQTFRLFTRFLPTLLHSAQTSLPLIVSQIAGTYVISSALLLRSNLPPEVSGVITEALGSPLDASFAQSWFEGWFLAAAGVTVLGILISRKVVSHDWDDWDDGGDLEMGKLS
ncbi:hypothetical protein K461DRAFT_276702 [Myriangium duriaei CBS 260.36]|uniref:Abscisic acid G-protein coupled receptor-like domain-containing protein n=1 Tax=Myriangium duriaei CBS 260.36 TaxID=1168546 RepID=A0A9P4J1Z1_9PEZI|nr:hypothetical protein K461DRAFT_276702 [Myriangium duriaei CBS 260.36]